MSVNEHTADAQVVRWSGKLFSAEDLRRHVNGQRELILLPRTLITPLAADELKARGIRITRQDGAPSGSGNEKASSRVAATWACLHESAEPMVAGAVESLKREGIGLAIIDLSGQSLAARGRLIGDLIRKAEIVGGVYF